MDFVNEASFSEHQLERDLITTGQGLLDEENKNILEMNEGEGTNSNSSMTRWGMLSLVHQQISTELEQASKTDTILVVTAVFFNLIMLAVNSGIASGGFSFMMFIFFAFTLAINAMCFLALRSNKVCRLKLRSGLLRLYDDIGVKKYYDPSILYHYSDRYSYFETIIAGLCGIAVFAPLVAIAFH